MDSAPQRFNCTFRLTDGFDRLRTERTTTSSLTETSSSNGGFERARRRTPRWRPSSPKRTFSTANTWLPETIEHVVAALIAYIPLLLVRPGVVTPDTKTYLYLDPGRFLRQVASMWNPTVGLGTVNHEYIGYLLPMGPFYWFFSAIGVPTWVAQRIWLGSILFGAAAGILYLCKTIDLRGPGRIVAALAFMLSPYFLQYAGRISVLLLPWAGLPWLVAFAALALRKGGWKYPALFAVVVALVSGINASSILYVGLAPVIWLIYAVSVAKEATWGRAFAAALRIGLLTVLVSLWWIAGLEIEAAYGVNVLKYTETVPATSGGSNASEVIRGLGYWYFYGGDRLGAWTNSALIYTQVVRLIALSYIIPVLAFFSAVMIRWRHRAFFVLVAIVGLVLSVGAHPFTHPTPVGGLLKAFMTDTTAGLAMRSTDRATPLVVLGLATLLGAGVSALWVRLPLTSIVTSVVLVGLILANNPALFNGDTIANDFVQPAKLPRHQMQAIHYLNATHPRTRVLAIPGNDFASFRWGNTVDTPQPAFLTRPFAIHEQQIMGSMATADTLYAIDGPIQDGTENWSSLAPMARLLSAGNILVEYDTQYEHYGIPQPQLMALQLNKTPPGLSDPVPFGTPVPNIPSTSMLDEADLSAPANPPVPPPLMVYTVNNPRPIVRGESNTGAIIVAGDATGLRNMASAGLLNTSSAIYYSGELDSHPHELHDLLAHGAALVVTDTNRKQAFRWDTLTANTGYIESPTSNPAKTDLSDSPINLFPKAPMSARTTAYDIGAVHVTASSYGNTVSYTPEDRAYNAIDGNLDTNWETGTFVPNPHGQWWQVSFANPITESHITLVQPLTGDTSRWITRATLTFDGKHRVTVNLGPASRTASGQVVSFSPRAFKSLRITIDSTSNDNASPATASAVGFAEVQIPGQHVTEMIKMPSDLLSAAGKSSIANRLTLIMDRQRVSPYPPRTSPETTINREFSLPTARTFSLSGTASISALIPDSQISQLVGVPGSNGSGVVAFSNGRLPGDLRAGASAAADGNPSTAWQPGFGSAYQVGDWLQYDLASPITFNHLNMKIVADGRHSVPTAISITATNDLGTVEGTRNIVLPPIADGRVAGSYVSVPVQFAPLTGSQIRITVTKARLESTTNYYSPTPIALPLGIAEVGIPGVRVQPAPPELPGNCMSNLIFIDGKPISVRIVGSTSAALNNAQMNIQPCGSDSNGITLGPGPHILTTALAHQPSTGWNINQLVLDSAPGGSLGPAPQSGVSPATQPGPSPTVTVQHQIATSIRSRVSGVSGPFELVLGESINSGWQAVATSSANPTTGSHSINLGSPQLMDSFANGWQVTRADLVALGISSSTKGTRNSFEVTFTWTPQARVWAALVVSAAAFVFCLVVGFLPERFRRFRRSRRFERSHQRDRRGWFRWSSRKKNPGASSPGALGQPALAAATATTISAPWDRVVTTDRPTSAPILQGPWRTYGSRPPLWAIALISVAVGLITGGISAPLVGVACALATLAALLVPHVRLLTSLLAVGLLAAGGATVVWGQLYHFIPESSNWPTAYDSAGVLVWMAAVFLVVDVVVTTTRVLTKSSRAKSAPQPHQQALEVPSEQSSPT